MGTYEEVSFSLVAADTSVCDLMALLAFQVLANKDCSGD